MSAGFEVSLAWELGAIATTMGPAIAMSRIAFCIRLTEWVARVVVTAAEPALGAVGLRLAVDRTHGLTADIADATGARV